MRTIFALATGLALTLSTASYAEMAGPEAQHVATSVSSAAPANAETKVTCHHLVHEGSLSPIVQCGDQKTWTRTRQETDHQLWEIQVHSFSRPL
jgi:hypothetical protein